MKRHFSLAFWLPLVITAATAFAQPPTAATTGSATAAKSPALTASLLLVKADWSKVPAAKEIETELRGALKDATVPKDLLDDLPGSGPEILFAPEAASIFTPEHYRELLAWLKAK